MAITKVGHDSNSNKTYVLDAGFLIKDPIFLNGEITGGVGIGVTAGGGTFTLEQETRLIEEDGMFVATKGNRIKVAENAQLELSVKTIWSENVKMAFVGNLDTTDLNYDIVTTKENIEDADYIGKIAYVGRYGVENALELAGKPVIILMENVLNTSGATMEFADNAEVVIPLVLVSHALPTQFGTRKLPVSIMIPSPKFGLNITIANFVALETYTAVLFNSTTSAEILSVEATDNTAMMVILPSQIDITNQYEIQIKDRTNATVGTEQLSPQMLVAGNTVNLQVTLD